MTIQDANSNTVTTSSLTITATITSGSGGSFISGNTAIASSGIATFSGLGISGVAGTTYTITYSSGSLTVATGTVTLGFGSAAQAAIVTQPSGAVNATALTGQAVIRVTDSAGNTVTSYGGNVVASIASGTGVLSGTTTVAASSGIATFANLIITGTAGDFTLTFTPTSLTSITSSAFALTASAPTQLSNSTPAAGASSGIAFSTQPVVTVQDASGNTVTTSSLTITATITSGSGGSFISGNTASASSGIATFSGLGISGTAGTTYTITYSSGSLTVATGTITLSSGIPSKLSNNIPAAGASSGIAFSTQPVVTIQDANSNTVTTSSLTITAAITAGVGGSLIGTTTATASSGVATFTNLGISGIAGNTYAITNT